MSTPKKGEGLWLKEKCRICFSSRELFSFVTSFDNPPAAYGSLFVSFLVLVFCFLGHTLWGGFRMILKHFLFSLVFTYKNQGRPPKTPRIFAPLCTPEDPSKNREKQLKTLKTTSRNFYPTIASWQKKASDLSPPNSFSPSSFLRCTKVTDCLPEGIVSRLC